MLTRKDFMGNHEWCFYGWREGAAHHFFGPTTRPTSGRSRRSTRNAMVHLTEKPVELARRAMQYSLAPGENVLDLFGGSGSHADRRRADRAPRRSSWSSTRSTAT